MVFDASRVDASISDDFPPFHPHIDVLFFISLLAVGYVVLLRTVGPRRVQAGAPTVTPLQLACFSGGVLATFVVSTWPIHDIAEGSLFSVHMVQHLTYTLVAAPLVLLGTPGWMMRAIIGEGVVFRIVRFCARMVPGVIIFNLVVVVSHWPAVVNEAIASHPFHLLVHVVVFGSGLLAWLPIVSPMPEIPRFAPIGRMVFLFLQSIVPTVPASFLTFGTTPLYRSYEDLPHLFGLSVLNDQLIAGLIMKIGAGLLLWMVIALTWFKWAAREERIDQLRLDGRAWQNGGQGLVDRDMRRVGMRSR